MSKWPVTKCFVEGLLERWRDLHPHISGSRHDLHIKVHNLWMDDKSGQRERRPMDIRRARVPGDDRLYAGTDETAPWER